MSGARGTGMGLASVLLVTAAQLGMRWGMSRLPGLGDWPAAFAQGQLTPAALAPVLASVAAYGLSMLCWLVALRSLPLGRAYSLLSISYALVYVLAACLPGFDEALSWPRTLGVALVILGVLTINSRRRAERTSPRSMTSSPG